MKLQQSALTVLITALTVVNAAVIPSKRDLDSTYSIPVIFADGLITETKNWLGEIEKDIGFKVDTTSSGLNAIASQKYLLQSIFDDVITLKFNILKSILSWIGSLFGSSTSTSTSSLGLGSSSSLIQQLIDNNKLSGGVYSIFANVEPTVISIVDDVITEATLLIGGVDVSKYTGDLISFNLIGDSGVSFTIAGIQINGTVLPTDGLTVTVDTTSKLTQLPNDILNSVLDIFGGSTGELDGIFSIQCPNSDDNLILNIAGIDIQVNLNQLVAFNSDGTCQLAATKSNSGLIVLGANLLTTVYTVVDLVDKVIAFAEPVFNDHSSIQSITSLTQLL